MVRTLQPAGKGNRPGVTPSPLLVGWVKRVFERRPTVVRPAVPVGRRPQSRAGPTLPDYRTAATIAKNESAFRLAPPTKAPSTSG